MPALRITTVPEVVEEVDDHRWDDLGVHPEDVAEWKAQGFGPFEAAMAQGDGFTPSVVSHYRQQFLQVVGSWVREHLDSEEGLRWHRAGFAAKEAVRWRAEGMDVEAARARRARYGTDRITRGKRPAERSVGRTSPDN